MTNAPGPRLIPVHICKFCGAKIDRKSIAPEVVIRGIIPCPKCGQEAALNLEILDAAEKIPPRRQTS